MLKSGAAGIFAFPDGMKSGAQMRPDERLEEAALIAGAKNGDMNAYENLVRLFQHRIYRLCWRMTGAHQSADDIAQETFIKAYFSLSRFDENLPLYPWLRRIAINTALNLIEDRKREVPFDPVKLESASSDAGKGRNAPPPGFAGGTPLHHRPESPEDRLEQKQFEQRFQEALASLPPDQRSVFVLRFYEGQSYEEIARALDVRVGTVMSRLNRARQKLKVLLGDILSRRS
jgi:RNA polymerase sigma-70 factor (ECF subfamily)